MPVSGGVACRRVDRSRSARCLLTVVDLCAPCHTDTGPLPSPEYMSSPVSLPGRDRSPRPSLHLRRESIEASLHPVLRQHLRNRAAAMSPASSPSQRQSAMPVLMSHPERESLNLGTAAFRGCRRVRRVHSPNRNLRASTATQAGAATR